MIKNISNGRAKEIIIWATDRMDLTPAPENVKKIRSVAQIPFAEIINSKSVVSG